MRKYLANLHSKSDHHKKRFALLASASFTLLIFGVWSLATFGNGGTLAEAPGSDGRTEEVSPFESLLGGVAASLRALRGNFDELKAGLEVVEFQADNTDAR